MIRACHYKRKIQPTVPINKEKQPEFEVRPAAFVEEYYVLQFWDRMGQSQKARDERAALRYNAHGEIEVAKEGSILRLLTPAVV